MQTLSVLAVEDGAIIVTSPAGERFRLPVDAALRARISGPLAQSDEKRLSPREIQSHIRSGLTAEQVAAMTGVPVASIERFVGPVLAERAYIVDTALTVRLPPETEGARARTFGAVMGERLDALAAKEVRWSSAKEPSGWILAVSFIADDVQHSARWRFDAKHMRLDADNVEASTLSQQGVPAALTPRLRAIEPTAPVTIVPPAASAAPAAETPTAAQAKAPAAQSSRPPQLHGARVAPVPPAEPDSTRFDSAVFRLPPIEPGPKQDQESRRNPAAHVEPTGDRLEDLQRRRGERQPAPVAEPEPELPATRAMDVVETGDVFAPRPTPIRREPAAERPQAPVRREEPSRREPASIHRLPTRTPASEQPTAPIPPAFARPGAGSSSTSRATPQPPRTTPERSTERPTEPIRRRRDRGRNGFGGLEPVDATEPSEEATPQAPVSAGRPRRGRTSMPSWDEIVFGRDEP